MQFISNINAVYRKLKTLNIGKAAGLDQIPCKLLKIAAEVVAHVENISKKIASAIGALKRVRQFIDTNTALKIYEALIQPHFDYCSTVWDG